MRSRKCTELPCAAEPARARADTRSFDGNCGRHLVFSDPRKGGERIVAEYRRRLPAGFDEILRVCREAQAHTGDGQPRRPGGFPRRPLPSTPREQERGAASGFLAEFLPLRSDSGTDPGGSNDESRIAKDPALASRLSAFGRSRKVAGTAGRENSLGLARPRDAGSVVL